MLTIKRKTTIACLMVVPSLAVLFSFHQRSAKTTGPVEIGVSRIDITPEYPVRLTGDRRKVFDSIEQKLWAKALVLDQKGKQPMVWITLDLVGFPGFFADDLFGRLAQKIGLKDRAQLVSIGYTHAQWS